MNTETNTGNTPPNPSRRGMDPELKALTDRLWKAMAHIYQTRWMHRKQDESRREYTQRIEETQRVWAAAICKLSEKEIKAGLRECVLRQKAAGRKGSRDSLWPPTPLEFAGMCSLGKVRDTSRPLPNFTPMERAAADAARAVAMEKWGRIKKQIERDKELKRMETHTGDHIAACEGCGNILQSNKPIAVPVLCLRCSKYQREQH